MLNSRSTVTANIAKITGFTVDQGESPRTKYLTWKEGTPLKRSDSFDTVALIALGPGEELIITDYNSMMHCQFNIENLVNSYIHCATTPVNDYITSSIKGRYKAFAKQNNVIQL
jgi:hypothetical protein